MSIKSKINDILTERAKGKDIYDTLYTKVFELLMKPNQKGDMSPLVDLCKSVIRDFEQGGVHLDIHIRDGVNSSSGAVYNKKMMGDTPVVKMVFEFPTAGAISQWMWGGDMTEMYAKKYAAEIAGTVSHEFVHYTQQVSRDKKSFKQKPVEPDRKEKYTAYLSNPDEIAAYGEGAAQELLHMAGGDVAKAKKKLKMFPRDSHYYKSYDLYVKQQNPEAWKKFLNTVVKYLDAASVVKESMVINPTQYSDGCEVFTVKSASQLRGLIDRFNDLRGMWHWDNSLDVWDASKATHNAYENSFGDGGARRLMLDKYGVEYNVMDFEKGDDPRAMILTQPVIRRVYGTNIQLISNDM